MNKMTLLVPAGQEYCMALRSLASCAGTMCDLTLDLIDDLRIAVDEAWDLLAHQPLKVESMLMQISRDEKNLHLRLHAERVQKEQCCEPADPETARLIIGTLVTDIHLEGDACGIHTVCMNMPLYQYADER